MMSLRFTKYKMLLLSTIFGFLVVGGLVILYKYQLRPEIQVQLPPSSEISNSSVAELFLIYPSTVIPYWYIHRLSNESIILTRTSELPDIGDSEGYAYGEQILVSVMPFTGDILYPENWLPISWINDEAMVHESNWTTINNVPLLRIRHEAGGASSEQLTYYLFYKDLVYNFSLYPLDDNNEQEFISFVSNYARQLHDTV